MAEDNRLAEADPDDIANRLAGYRAEGTARRAYFASCDAKAGLIPDSAVRPKDGVVESVADPRFMERVCLALASNFSVEDRSAPRGRREASIAEKLAKAGCSPDQYLQIKDDPQFLPMLGHVSTAVNLIPRLPAIIDAQAGKAADGDAKAAEVVLRLTKMLEQASVDEVRAEFSNLEEDAWVRTMRAELRAGLDTLDAYTAEAPEVTEDELQAAKDARPKPPPPPPKLDHEKIHSE